MNIRAASVQSVVTSCETTAKSTCLLFRVAFIAVTVYLEPQYWPCGPGTGSVFCAAEMDFKIASAHSKPQGHGFLSLCYWVVFLEPLYMLALYVTLVVLALVLSFKAAALLFLYAILGAQPLSGKLALIFLCRLPAARGFVTQFACGASTILC